MNRLALVLVLSVVVGCAAVEDVRDVVKRSQPRYQVRVHTDTGFGQGVLLEAEVVATVAHVVSGADWIRVWRGIENRAATVASVHTGLGPEPIVLLELGAPMAGSTAEAMPVRPGDSGSPCIGQNGQVIGLVTGWRSTFRRRKDGRLYLERIVVVTPIESVLE